MSEEEVRKRKRSIREEVLKLRMNLEENLYEFCVENGGHNFWEWQDSSWIDVSYQQHNRESRSCSWCGHSEHRS